jgi:hypothetical protein
MGYGVGMINTDMNIVEFSAGNYKLTDAYSTATVAPSADTQLGGSDSLTNAKYSKATNGNPQLTFERKLNTGDSKDKVLALVYF